MPHVTEGAEQHVKAPAAGGIAGPERSEVLLSSTFGPPEFVETWANALRQQGLKVLTFPSDSTDLSKVEFAIVFDPPPGLLARCTNLKAIHSMGAGVSPGMLEEAVCPSHVPLLRVVDQRMAQRMATFVIWAVINCQRKFDAYLVAQQAHSWQQGKALENYLPLDNVDLNVGVMGVGNLGAAVVGLLLAAGYTVSTWTRSQRQQEGVRCFHGAGQLQEFAAQANVVVCLVPLTEETRGILDARFFDWLPAGASVINVSRGQHVVDGDLIAALDSSHLASVVLDVFHTEPLPPESPLWDHPKIRVLPHVSGITHRPSAIQQMVRLRACVLAGKPLPEEVVVDRERGY